MAFFKRTRELEARLSVLSAQAAGLGEQLNSLLARPAQLDLTPITGTLSSLSDRVGRHDLAIADLLDTLEEQRAAMAEAQERLTAALGESAAQQLEPLREQNRQLLRLTLQTQDQLFLLARAAEDDPSWAAQFRAVEQTMAKSREACGLVIFGRPGDPADTARVEVAELRPTADPALDRTIAEVYFPGYLLRGQLLRKARAAVWRRGE